MNNLNLGRDFSRLVWSVILTSNCGVALAQSTASTLTMPCLPLGTAPSLSLNFPKPWGNDTGVVTDRFLDLRVRGVTIKVRHGVDLFDGKAGVDFALLKQCGADFAFLEISGKTRVFSANTRSLLLSALTNQVEIFPYHYLGVADEVKERPFTYQSFALPEAVLTVARAEGQRQGKIFLEQFAVASRTVDAMGKGKLTPKYIALDLEERMAPDTHPDARARLQFGQYYYEMACAWVKTVRQDLPNPTLLLYTSPGIAMDYKFFEAGFQSFDPTNSTGSCLSSYLIWLSFATQGGGHPADDFLKGTPMGVYARAVCFGGNQAIDRCLVHQYSHRGFGAKNSPKVIPRPTSYENSWIDLDRIHESEIPWNHVQ
jgi:hypothetical protein